MASNPIEELDDAVVLVIILAVVAVLFWSGFQILKLMSGTGDASGIGGVLGSLTGAAGTSAGSGTVQSGNSPTLGAVVNSPALPPLSQSYGSTLSSMAVDGVKGIGSFFSGIWYGLVGGVSGGSSNPAQSAQGGPLGGVDFSQYAEAYVPQAAMAGVQEAISTF